MTTKDKYIQKLEELVSAYKYEPITGNYDEDRDYGNYIERLESELSSLKAQIENEGKPIYDYAKIRKAGLKKHCISGISCNLCEVANHSAFRQCFIDSYNSEFASDEELEKLGLIDG